MEEADLIILVGRKLDYQLAYGSPAIFNKANFVRISSNPYELVDNRRGMPEIYGEPHLVFKDINSRVLNTNFDKEWILETKEFHSKKIEKLNSKKINNLGNDGKIHPNHIFNCIKNLVSDKFIGIADGGDIFLKDGGTLFGTLNSGGGSNLNIKSGSTQALAFSGANATFSGTIVGSSSITASGDITAFSDARLKTGIRNIDNALNMVGDMRGVYFIKDGEAGIGVIAQEVEKVLPEVVKNNEEYKSVAYGNMVGVLIEAIKELKKEVETLKESS